MEIWQMKYFIQVYNDKSFSKAAKNLYISQQGLSKTIKNMEEEFDVPLLDRSVKGVRPTEYGEILFEKAQKIVKDYDQMVDYMYKKAKQKKGTITIGMSNVLHSDFFSTICDFQDQYPDIKLEIIELGSHACEKYLEENLIDVCFAGKPDSNITFDFLPVSTFDMMVLVNEKNSLSQKLTINIEELKNEKFIMLSSEYKIRSKTIDSCIQYGFYPDIIFTTSQLNLIIELVNLNKGIAVLPVLNSLKARKLGNNINIMLFDKSPFRLEVGFVVKRYRKLNYITSTLIEYSLKTMEQKLE